MPIYKERKDMAQSFVTTEWRGAGGTHFVSAGSYSIEVEGVVDMQKRLDMLRSSHPRMDKDLKKIMRLVINQAKKRMMNTAKSEIGSGYPYSQGDQRQAYRAIKSMVYKRIFGGNINIISRRKRSGYVASVPAKHVLTGRGGNRRARSERTQQVMSYWGEDRGFILRWLNGGTKTRQIKTEANKRANRFVGRGHTSASMRHSRNGNRGSIAGNHWFGDNSFKEMYQASEALTHWIDRAIQEVWGDNSITEATFNRGDYSFNPNL